MRIRYKAWARPELAACPYYVQDGAPIKGGWRGRFSEPDKPLYAELGCGKGAFVSVAALRYEDVNWIACDIKSEMLAYTRRKTEKIYAEQSKKPKNLQLLTLNIEKTDTVFGENELDRIYINFCPPWKREKEYKHRLTHPNQLRQYAVILKPGAEIHFKTDDDKLFEDSVLWFEESGFTLTLVERDLTNSDITDNIVTEHEAMFIAEGKSIKFLIAKNVKTS